MNRKVLLFDLPIRLGSTGSFTCIYLFRAAIFRLKDWRFLSFKQSKKGLTLMLPEKPAGIDYIVKLVLK